MSYTYSFEVLKELFGEDFIKKLGMYLHSYVSGDVKSVKPTRKRVTIYYLLRASDRLTIRTEGEDDMILTSIADRDVPTIIFRKLKAVYLREFLGLLRSQWSIHENSIKDVWFKDVDFLFSCSLSVGIAGGRGTIHGRCMKCPADVLMGAVSAKEKYNLVSRFVGDSAYAVSNVEEKERRTGNAVDEITYTTIMLKGSESKEARTGALYTMSFIVPGTIFVGKTVLYMPSPPELIYTLWLLTRVMRVGARTSVQGTLESYPVAVIGDLSEIGSSYEVAERILSSDNDVDINKAYQHITDYVKEKMTSSNGVYMILSKDLVKKISAIDVLNENLVKELWLNAKNYVDAVEKYITMAFEKEKKEDKTKGKTG